MNKQEVIEEIKTCKSEYDSNSRDVWCYEKGFEDARSSALNSINKLDEPEKPVLTKAEAEWIDKLTDFYSLPDALYYITRCGYGYLFVFEMAKKTYELPVDSGATYGEFCELKERLVNAVIYGYEVEKEKLYRARHKLTGEYLSQNYAKTGYYHGLDHFHILKLSKKDWEELGVLDDKVYEIEEAEE
jgi:hypothetical protein